jgi:hypothetical protein
MKNYLAAFGMLVLAAVSLDSQGGTGKVPPLFVFEEDGDTLSFWSPSIVRLIRHLDGGTKVCQSELSERGNLWTGSDVERAFQNAVVQNSLKTTKAPYSADNSAKVTAGDASIIWAKECDKCLGQPPEIKHLYTVLHVVMQNRRLLCQ